MGGWLSRRLFPRAKDLSAYRLLLEGLEAEVGQLSTRRASKFAQHRRIVRSLVLYSSAAFVGLCGLVYALAGQYSRAVVVAPIVAFPLLVVLAKRAIDAMFDSSLRHDDRILARLEKQKDRMLEELIEQTNFTRTQQLINTFQKRPPQQQQMARQAMRTPSASIATPRKAPPAAGQASRPSPAPLSGSPAVPSRTSSFTPPQAALPGLLPGQPYVTPADIQRFHRTDVQKPAQRSAVDKVIDFALGDGPNNRYALICQSCYTHNGLVKEDDLDSVRYRCVMCNYVNGKTLPPDWKPAIHSSTVCINTSRLVASTAASSDIESVIQSTPTKPQPPAQPQPHPHPQQQQQPHSAQLAKDDTDRSLFFPTGQSSAGPSVRLPSSARLSAFSSSPSASPAHTASAADERKEAATAAGEQAAGTKEAERSDKKERKEE